MMKDMDTKSIHGKAQLKTVQAICIAAQRFYQQAAKQVSDGNLRYKFAELSALHHNAAQRLPIEAAHDPAPNLQTELIAVQLWYQHQHTTLTTETAQPLALFELYSLLQKQLSALKQLTLLMRSYSAKISLAHLTAALQIACDQLPARLKVLPVDGKNIQTKN